MEHFQMIVCYHYISCTPIILLVRTQIESMNG